MPTRLVFAAAFALAGCSVDPSGPLNQTEAQTTAACVGPADADGDGYMRPECGGSDCDDGDMRRYPGNAEVCDDQGHDEDCNPWSFGDRDADGDGFVDIRCYNLGLDGGRVHGRDCNDADPSVHPIATETCDLVDNNCNGQIDEGVIAWQCFDNDGDGFGSGPPAAVSACSPSAAGMSLLCNDCDDNNAALFPGSQVCADGTSVKFCGAQLYHVACSATGDAVCATQPNGAGLCTPTAGSKGGKPR